MTSGTINNQDMTLSSGELWRRQVERLKNRRDQLDEAVYDRQLLNLCNLYITTFGVHPSMRLPLFDRKG